jgi:hypothetical protein
MKLLARVGVAQFAERRDRPLVVEIAQGRRRAVGIIRRAA